MTAGTTPMRTSVKAKVAVSTATAMSQAASSPIPPARAGPATRATTGCGRGQDRAQDRGELRDPLRAGHRTAGLPQVHAGAEDRTGVAQDDHADGRVGDRRVEVVLQLAAELRRQGVAVAR